MRTITVNPPKTIHIQRLDLSVKPRQAFVLARQTSSRFFRDDSKALQTAQKMAEGSTRALLNFEPLSTSAKQEVFELSTQSVLQTAKKNPIPSLVIDATVAFSSVLVLGGLSVIALAPPSAMVGGLAVFGSAASILGIGLFARQSYAYKLAKKISDGLTHVANQFLG